MWNSEHGIPEPKLEPSEKQSRHAETANSALLWLIPASRRPLALVPVPASADPKKIKDVVDGTKRMIKKANVENVPDAHS